MTYITFTDLSGFEIILETASIVEVARYPAIEAKPEVLRTSAPEHTCVAVRSGSRYMTDLPVAAFDAVIKPVKVAAPVAPFGYLQCYATGATLRPATESERAESIAAAAHDGGSGVILVDGESCYVG